jgi:hypothetical protein
MAFEQYLVIATNQLHELEVQAKFHPDEEGSKILEASIIGCQTLARLLEDRSFGRTLEQMSAARNALHGTHAEEFHRLIEAEDSFENFLKIEKEVMVKGGLFPDVANSLVQESRHALERVRQGAVPVNEVILATIKLRDEACHISDELYLKEEKGRVWEKWRKRIRRVGQGMAGGALIGLNVVSFPPTGPLALLSTAVGTHIIIDAAKPGA